MFRDVEPLGADGPGRQKSSFLEEKLKGSMNAIVEALASFLGFIAWLMVGVALPNRYWKVSTVDGNVITTSTIYENLWMSCATDSTGVHNCRDFPSLLALNGMWPMPRLV